MTEPRIVSEPRGDAGDATFVREALALYNVAATGDDYYSPLAIFLKDERDAVLGGPLVISGEDGSTSTPSGLLNLIAGRGTGRSYSEPQKTKPGRKDAMVSS